MFPSRRLRVRVRSFLVVRTRHGPLSFVFLGALDQKLGALLAQHVRHGLGVLPDSVALGRDVVQLAKNNGSSRSQVDKTKLLVQDPRGILYRERGILYRENYYSTAMKADVKIGPSIKKPHPPRILMNRMIKAPELDPNSDPNVRALRGVSSKSF